VIRISYRRLKFEPDAVAHTIGALIDGVAIHGS
jgi:hypothetical protein